MRKLGGPVQPAHQCRLNRILHICKDVLWAHSGLYTLYRVRFRKLIMVSAAHACSEVYYPAT